MTKEIRDILENVMYWDTCPADYKEKIKNYLSSEPQQQALNIPVVMQRSEQLNSFCLWYKTTDFNCEGNSPEDCVKEYLKTI